MVVEERGRQIRELEKSCMKSERIAAEEMRLRASLEIQCQQKDAEYTRLSRVRLFLLYFNFCGTCSRQKGTSLFSQLQ